MTLSFSCPTCGQPLLATSARDGFICANAHHFGYDEDVLVLLDADFKQTLDNFLTKFEPLRQVEAKRLLDTAVYETLPFTPELQANHEWRLRGYDLIVTNQLLAGRKAQHILEIGAWNGWLSNRLSQQGHCLTAVDYFTDEYDGLKAKKHYCTQWQTIQMDLTDLSVLNGRFDIVILNRCTPFFVDPIAYVLTAQEKVKPGGMLLLLGLSFFQNPGKKAASVAANRRQLQANGLDYFRPMKGYLDFNDKQQLQVAGIELRPYPQLWPANLKSWLVKSAPRYFYGVSKQ